MMQGFAIVISGCKIVPPTAKAAVILTMWMFGAIPNMAYEDYRQAYRDAGGADQIARIERCFTAWPDIHHPLVGKRAAP